MKVVLNKRLLSSSFIEILFLFIVIASFGLRLYNLDLPLLGRYEFRQTQTAYTVRYFIEHGVNIFDYVTPVLGENARIPFEFPIFQLAAYWIYKICGGLVSIDGACRLSNIIWFFLSAYTVLKLSEYIFDNKIVSRIACIIYLILPYNIYWSRTAMIDYCSAFFVMAYACMYISWLRTDSKYQYYILILFGIMAYLSKVTSVIVVMPVIMFYLYKKTMAYRCLDRKLLVWQMIKCIVPLAIPLILGALWAKYTDIVKIKSGFAYLTSSGLAKWNFGDFEQRLDLKAWSRILERFYQMILPGAWITIPITIFYVRERDYLIKCMIVLLGIIITPLVFFNLYYVHEYYYIAISPMLAILEAAFLYYAFSNFGRIKKVLMAIILCLSLGMVSSDFNRAIVNDYTGYDNHYFWKLSDFIRRNTDKEDRILILDNDWNPAVQYYAYRNGVTIKNEWFNSLENKKFDYVFFKDKNNSVLKLIGHTEPVAIYNEWTLAKVIQ